MYQLCQNKRLLWTGLGLAMVIGCVSGTMAPAKAQSRILFQAQAQAGPVVTGIRIGDYTAKTRLVLDLNWRLGFKVFALADPYRVVIDLPEVAWRLNRKTTARSGLVTGLRYGLFKPGNSRVVIDVSGPVRVAKSFLLPPGGRSGYRLVVDLSKISRVAMLRNLRARPALSRPLVQRWKKPKAPVPEKPKAKQKRKGLPIIVIDPGHGGVDPGGVGAAGERTAYDDGSGHYFVL